jgi:PAS domain S-box-containing protein
MGRFASAAYHALESIEELKLQIAARERAEMAVREMASGLQAKLRRLVDSNVIGVIIWQYDGQIIDANETFLHMVGYDRNDLAAGRLNYIDLTPSEWHGADERRLEEFAATGTARPYEKEFQHKSGHRVPVMVGGAVFQEGSDQGVAFVVDVSDRKRAEAAARESRKGYREVQRELAHANRVATIGHLSASIAHELNQPIGAAITYANAAKSWLSAQPPDLEEVHHALELVIECGVQAGNVIDRIRALVKKAPSRQDDVDVNEAILAVIALTRSERARRGVSTETQLADNLPAVAGDRVQLQQVILNLLLNAIEAMSSTPAGRRQLLISTVKSDLKNVLVKVQDSGPGFTPENFERLFEAFYTTKPDGLGMGLSICRSIVEAHQGRLWATANAPQGAIFQFTLPAGS